MNYSAQCLPGFEWSFSSTHQSPCNIASSLAGICSKSNFTVAPLASGAVYVGTSAEEGGNSCLCSSVYYSLLSACSYCQSRSYIRWSSFTTNCTTFYLQRFMEPIPKSVSVPKWAYLDVSVDDAFNTTLAQQTAATKSPGTNIAALAGGIVGGLAVIGLIVGLVTYWITRRHTRRARKKRLSQNPASENAGAYTPPFGMAPTSVSGNSQQQRVPLLQSQNAAMGNRRSSNFQYSAFPGTTGIGSNTLSSSASQTENLMTRVTPFTASPPSNSNVLNNMAVSKQPLSAGSSSNFSNQPMAMASTSTASTSHTPAIVLDNHNPKSAIQLSSINSAPYQEYHLLPPHQGSSFSPLSTHEQLPAYSEIISRAASPRPQVSEKEGR